MKKLLALSLMSAIFMSLAACSDRESPDDKAKSDTDTSASSATATTSPTAAQSTCSICFVDCGGECTLPPAGSDFTIEVPSGWSNMVSDGYFLEHSDKSTITVLDMPMTNLPEGIDFDALTEENIRQIVEALGNENAEIVSHKKEKIAGYSGLKLTVKVEGEPGEVDNAFMYVFFAEYTAYLFIYTQAGSVSRLGDFEKIADSFLINN